MEVLASEEGFKVGGGDIGAAIMSLVIQFFLSERIPKAYSDNSGKKTRIVDLGMEGNRGGGGALCSVKGCSSETCRLRSTATCMFGFSQWLSRYSQQGPQDDKLATQGSE